VIDTQVTTEYSKKYPCVKCGYCCKKASCSYGKLDSQGNCEYLIIDDPEIGTYLCVKYKEIKEKEKNCPFPMFDWGCSSSLFNNIRDAVLCKMKEVKI